jgi:GrpB-like predicted nucleotidyltransferase (UPF0157 family)
MAREMIVVPYDYKWPDQYNHEKEILIEILDKLIINIEHFGSTSIKGMSAKPIIDVMIIVADITQVDQYSKVMTEHGFIPKGENGIPGRRYFVRYIDDGENHAAHIHIYERNNPHVADELLFRDFLANDQESFDEYERVKVAAAEKYRYSPLQYTDAKHECVMKIMQKLKNDI